MRGVKNLCPDCGCEIADWQAHNKWHNILQELLTKLTKKVEKMRPKND